MAMLMQEIVKGKILKQISKLLAILTSINIGFLYVVVTRNKKASYVLT